MSPARAVLVGSDLAAGSDEAIRQAHHWALGRHAHLFVCHVAADVRLARAATNGRAAARHWAAEELEQRVMILTGRSPHDLEVIVDGGTPEDVLVRRADELDAELIVVGGSAHGPLRKLFGGVAERVVRHAHAPVLVARRARYAGRILVATDFSDHSLPAVAAACAESHRRNARLHMVHCIHAHDAVGAYAGAFGAPEPSRTDVHLFAEQCLERDARRRMEAAVHRFSATAELHVSHGAAGPCIRALADELHPELVVVGTKGRTGLRRALLGSVAEYILRHAEQPTLVVRLGGVDREAIVDGPSAHAH